ncbi:MAG: ABC transporter ATP-binding protein [Bacillota bacterium]|uniref:ABC transporter ATP-binding protein n=1 Tax=Virgibacillus salarius TaxID=447199 RepID=A0A941DVJ1_9BACI|nr:MULTISPECIES: ABC transporter ATP-binding protein [Bacillaceae]NAZ08919.1 ATP-binding cassette domain-containing protein [Agaribacter marinus]MBR7796211.1 ABC transporter ATP-binding protein [Virgibacillus salarius]MCC2252392.1 ABC transporter ATP-binding protein [Virgibacillus sp. AGTR]MDY7045119.1 ABC transporter ATP-binding protein [Virgibacillus sp. M23]QRZ19645.1 ABC transporter ATP-binding protein [Virgibacillus sp. AGTR]
MTLAAMELIDVKRSIGNKEIIKGLSFSIYKGEVFGFIGPNGAGKTTTIRMMVGLMKLTDGDIHILGNSIKTNYKKAVREVGAIVENPEMYPFMSGWQNLMHYARMIPGVTKDRINEVINLVGLEKPIHDKVGKYSLGMRQRLGIAQALLHKPSVLILDEPTNGLDPAGIREIRQYIRKLAKEEDVAIIISSHLLSEIEQMCDRIGVIKNGELISIQDVGEQASVDNLTKIQVEVTPLEKAKNLLKEHYDIETIVMDNGLSFQGEKEKIPAIIKTFVENDCSIYQVSVTKGTLEDQFFELIGENTIE